MEIKASTSSTYEPKFNPKKHKRHRRVRPEKHPSIFPAGPNHAHRRLLKARERTVASFSRQKKLEYIEEIQKKEHREAIKRRIAKSKKTK